MLCVFILIKQRLCFRLHALQARVLQGIKPPTTSLVLSTLADLTRGKAELLAENALLRQQLIIDRSTDQATGLSEDRSADFGAPGQDGSDLERGTLPYPAGDTSALAP